MTLRALLDVNVLLALFDTRHMAHDRCKAWWSENERHGSATCPITQHGFLRIISQSSYFGSIGLTEAIRALRQWAASSQHEFWPDDLTILDPALIDHTRILGHKQITDVYLLALAVKHGGRFVTLDRRVTLAAVRGAGAEHLVVV